jgi:hypothetical protein
VQDARHQCVRLRIQSSWHAFLQAITLSTNVQLGGWLDCRAYPILRYCFNCPPFRPPDGVHIRRHSGFGQEKIGRSAGHRCPPFFLICHHAWSFLLPSDRSILATTHPAFHYYGKLRHLVSTTPITFLQHPRPQPSNAPIEGARSYAL